MASFIEIKTALEDHFRSIVETEQQDIFLKGHIDEATIQGYLEDSWQSSSSLTFRSPELELLDHYYIPEGFKHYLTTGKILDILSKAGIKIDLDGKDYTIASQLYHRMVIELLEEVKTQGEEALIIDLKPRNSGVSSSNAKPIEKPSPLNHVVASYIDEMKRSGLWGIYAEREKKECLSYLMELLGEGFDLKQLDGDKARYIKECLIKTPRNRNKIAATRDKPLIEQMGIADVEKLSNSSVNKYLSCYSTLCSWANSNHHIKGNPFEGLKVANRPTVKEAFSIAEINLILDELEKGKEGLAKTDFAYWGTLIAIYTGARLNEIASLTPHDIKQDTETGIWYFDITDEDETKRLKTKAAKRKVPIHDDLLGWDILKYAEQAKYSRRGSERLLLGLTYNEMGGWGRKLGRWFNGNLLPRLSIKKRSLTFHSLRHTFITQLRRSTIDNHTVRQLVGHEPDGITENVYNHDVDLKHLAQSLARLSYKPLKL